MNVKNYKYIISTKVLKFDDFFICGEVIVCKKSGCRQSCRLAISRGTFLKSQVLLFRTMKTSILRHVRDVGNAAILV